MMPNLMVKPCALVWSVYCERWNGGKTKPKVELLGLITFSRSRSVMLRGCFIVMTSKAYPEPITTWSNCLVVGDITSVVARDAKLPPLPWLSEVQCKSWQPLPLKCVRLRLTTWRRFPLPLGNRSAPTSSGTNTNAINNGDFDALQLPI